MSPIISFLILSFISGFVELGCILNGIHNNFSILQIVGIGLAYQVGNLSPNPIKLGPKLTIFASISSIIFFTLYLNFGHYSSLFLTIVTLSMVIQSLRALSKASVNTTLKRSFRILGFAFSFMIILDITTIVIQSLLLILSISSRSHMSKTTLLKPKIKFINFIMIIHQFHYFTYAYFVLYLFSRLGLSISLMTIFFILGWLTYTYISCILKKDYYVSYFLVGHTFLFFVLFLLALNYNNTLMIYLWILTGFGGGTVFCIKKINEIHQDSSSQDMEFSENIGHVVGVLLGMSLYYITSNISVVIFFSSICAIMAMALMFLFTRNKSIKSTNLTS